MKTFLKLFLSVAIVMTGLPITGLAQSSEFDLTIGKEAADSLSQLTPGSYFTFTHNNQTYSARLVGEKTDKDKVKVFLMDEVKPVDANEITESISGSINLSEISSKAFSGAMTAGIGTGLFLVFEPPSEQSKTRSVKTQLDQERKALLQDQKNFNAMINQGIVDTATGTIEAFDHLTTKPFEMPRPAGLNNYKFESQDTNFVTHAAEIYNKLKSSRPSSTVAFEAKAVGIAAVIAADKSSAAGLADEADVQLTVAEIMADIAVGLDPFTGTLRDGYEFFTGKNAITGQTLAKWERAVSGISLAADLATLGVAASAVKAIKGINRIFKVLKAPIPLEAERLINASTKTFILGKSSEVRKINLKSNLDPKWGLTRIHLDKHFFKNPKLALKYIDSAGNPDKWMNHIADLLQSPVSKTYRNGVNEIIKSYPKADGGKFKLGIRIFKKPNGEYDLVTVLTDQTKM